MDKRVYSNVCLRKGHAIGNLVRAEYIPRKDGEGYHHLQMYDIRCFQCGATEAEMADPPIPVRTRTEKPKGASNGGSTEPTQG